MLRAMGSTGRRKGPDSFIFFKMRTVDVQNFHCCTLNVGGPVGAAGVKAGAATGAESGVGAGGGEVIVVAIGTST